MMNAEKAALVLLLTLIFFPRSVQAQEPGLAVIEVWSVQCVVEDDPSRCSMNQQQHLQTEVDGERKVVGRLINATVVYAEDPNTGSRDPHISIDLPLGVSLAPGAALKVDDGQQLNWPYLQCTAAGCAISNKLDGELLSALKRGQNLIVAYRTWNAEKNTLIRVPLRGFTKAFNSIQ
mgnify:CR=1 FL=1